MSVGLFHATSLGHFGGQPFRLLDLRREMRDMIYEHMLVRKSIETRSGDCWGDHTTAHRILSLGLDEDDPPSWPGGLLVKARNRTTYKSPMAEDEGHASYEETKRGNRKYWLYPNLNIFMTNRQVYDESSAIYYEKNTFSFETGCVEENLCAPACRAFLQDRPLLSLQRIRSIRLRISNPMNSYAAAVHCDGDTLVETFEFIRDNLTLDCFSLEVGGWPPDMRSVPWHWNDYHRVFDKPHKWVSAFTKLSNLKSFSLKLFANCIGDVGRMVACAAFPRSAMLKNGAALGTKNIQAYNRHTTKHHLVSSEGRPWDMWERFSDRVPVVQCFDDEHGRSLLPPKARASPLFRSMKAAYRKRRHDSAFMEKVRNASTAHRQFGIDLHSIRTFLDNDVEMEEGFDEYGMLLGYDLSDDGDNDSLVSLDLDDKDCSFVRDDDYFDQFDG